jgi:hypothetical protein
MRFFVGLLGGVLGAVIVIIIASRLDLPISVRVSEVRDGLAAWVQAVGSILALVAIFLVQRWDHKETGRLREIESRAERERFARASMTSAKFLVAAIDSLVTVQKQLNGVGWMRSHVDLHRANLSAAMSSMRAIDHGRLPNERAVVAHVNLIQAGYSTELMLDAIERVILENVQPSGMPFESIRAGAGKSLDDLITNWREAGAELL